MKRYLCFGGPLDGSVVAGKVPDGYDDTDGFLVVWHAIKRSAVPMWRVPPLRRSIPPE
jgi:hypothetical protein